MGAGRLWATDARKYWLAVNTVRRYKSTAGYKREVVICTICPAQVWSILARFGCNVAESGVKWPKWPRLCVCGSLVATPLVSLLILLSLVDPAPSNAHHRVKYAP